MATKLNAPSMGTTFDSCTTQDIVSMRQMRLLRAAADAQLKAQQVAGQDALARGAVEQARMLGEKLCLTSWAHVLIEDAREARVENDLRPILLGCWNVWEGGRENADGARDQGAGASLCS